MKILLDTCTFLWIVSDSSELSTVARDYFQDPDNEVYLSSVSSWEICVKYDIGKLALPEKPDRFIPNMRQAHEIDSLPLDELSVLYLNRLPMLHHDPFDRMLACQALAHGLVILTPDDLLQQYPVRALW